MKSRHSLCFFGSAGRIFRGAAAPPPFFVFLAPAAGLTIGAPYNSKCCHTQESAHLPTQKDIENHSPVCTYRCRYTRLCRYVITFLRRYLLVGNIQYMRTGCISFVGPGKCLVHGELVHALDFTGTSTRPCVSYIPSHSHVIGPEIFFSIYGFRYRYSRKSNVLLNLDGSRTTNCYLSVRFHFGCSNFLSAPFSPKKHWGTSQLLGFTRNL